MLIFLFEAAVTGRLMYGGYSNGLKSSIKIVKTWVYNGSMRTKEVYE
jgi:hypothetical protein